MARILVLTLPGMHWKAHTKACIQVGGTWLAQALECVTRSQAFKIEFHVHVGYRHDLKIKS